MHWRIAIYAIDLLMDSAKVHVGLAHSNLAYTLAEERARGKLTLASFVASSPEN